jgi:uncharacterized membrane protein YhaH (DUF805 family)
MFQPLRDFAKFDGRSRRSEYWLFLLFTLVLSMVVALAEEAILGISIISSLLSLALLIPSLAVLVRRLHDTNRSGWWCLLWLIPVIGFIWLFVLLVLDSHPGDNRFGPNPKGV